MDRYSLPTNYKGKTDDWCQALAVVSGIANQDKSPSLFEVFKTEEHASPYMEKYVLEALFQMGYVDFAIERMKKRFGKMVNDTDYTTLFEGWGIGNEGFGGGTTNHAWSGGALAILSQYLCGIVPLTPGYELFQVIPKFGSVTRASATVESVKVIIECAFTLTPQSNLLLCILIDRCSEIPKKLIRYLPFKATTHIKKYLSIFRLFYGID